MRKFTYLLYVTEFNPYKYATTKGRVYMHVEKYIRSACNNMLAHYTREHISSKSDIDTARSKNNYYFGSKNPRKRLHQILSSENIKCMKRKDVNVLIDIVVTIPEHWKSKPSKERKAFFKAVTDVLYDKFCSEEKDNFVGGYIHADETSEHEHFAFVALLSTIKVCVELEHVM